MELTQAAQYQGRTADGMTAWADQQASLDGFRAARRNADATHNKRVMEAARLYADVMAGRVEPWLLKEAMNPRTDFVVAHLMEKYPGIYGDPGGRWLGLRETMSVTDYQALFVDVLDRMYYGYYNAYPVVNKSLVRVHQLRDFRLVSRYLLDGVVTPLTKMDAAAPQPQRALLGPDPQDGHPATSTAPLQYQPYLYQAMTSVNWRAFVNDDLGIFRDLSNRLAIAANRGISKFITTFYVDAAGPNATLYQANYANLITTTYGASSNNPELSTQGIIDALNVLSRMRDSGGDPILITGRLKLWYGPSLAGTANNVMNALNLYVQNQGGTGNTQGFPVQFLNVTPWMIQRMDPIMDPYIPIVCTASGIQDTMWGITVDPEAQARPNTEVGFLTGFETPQLYQKVPNTMRVGGGVDQMMGDFYTMDQDMKIVTVMGGVQIDGRSTVASTGAKV
jgi:hypothetical protein